MTRVLRLNIKDPAVCLAVRAMQAFEEMGKGYNDFAYSLLERAMHDARKILGADTIAELYAKRWKGEP